VTNFSRALPIILKHEGGYVDHPKDPGGATNLGITHKTLASWRGRPVTKSDVRNLTKAEAGRIYRANYWNAVNGDSLPPGVDLVVFDFAVNSGVSRAAKALQKLVHAEQDGHIGPATLAQVAKMDPVSLVNGYSEARMGFLRGLHHWPTFKGGWTRRVSETREAALGMVRKVQPSPEEQANPLAALWAWLMRKLGK
jgi:lysozyme family protein